MKKSWLPAIGAVLPVLIVYLTVYFSFHYTYADWVKNSYQYAYSSSLKLRIIEYIKCFGSLFNFLGIFTAGGAYVFWKERKTMDPRVRLFVIAAVVSFLPVFFWGGITQRIMAITVPASIIVACFFFKKYEKYMYWFITFLLLYLLANFFMDSFILKFVNLPF